MVEEKKNNSTMINIAIGIGAVLITFFVASGEWDIFDFGVSLFICLGLIYSIKKNYILLKDIIEKVIFSVMASCISTALIISIISMIAAFVPNSCL